MAGNPFHLRIVEAVGVELVVRRQPFEHGRALEDQVRLFGGQARRKRQRENGSGEKSGKLARENLPGSVTKLPGTYGW